METLVILVTSSVIPGRWLRLLLLLLGWLLLNLHLRVSTSASSLPLLLSLDHRLDPRWKNTLEIIVRRSRRGDGSWPAVRGHNGIHVEALEDAGAKFVVHFWPVGQDVENEPCLALITPCEYSCLHLGVQASSDPLHDPSRWQGERGVQG